MFSYEIAGEKDILIRKSLAVGIVFLFAVSSFIPISNSQIKTIDEETLNENLNFDRIQISEITDNTLQQTTTLKPIPSVSSESSNEPVRTEPLQSINSGLINSPWPMKCHNIRHTSQSPYSTENNSGIEIWRFRSEHYLGGTMESSPVIDNNGKI